MVHFVMQKQENLVITKIFSKHPDHLGLGVANTRNIQKILELIQSHDLLEAFRLFGLHALGEAGQPLTKEDISEERRQYVIERLNKADNIRNQLFFLYSDKKHDINCVFEFIKE